MINFGDAQQGSDDGIFVEPKQTSYLMLAISILLLSYSIRKHISKWHIVLSIVFLFQGCCSVLFWSTFDRSTFDRSTRGADLWTDTNRSTTSSATSSATSSPTSHRSPIHVIDATMARITFCLFLYYVFVVGALSAPNANCYSVHRTKMVRRFKRFVFSIALCGCGYNILHSHKGYKNLKRSNNNQRHRFVGVDRIRNRHLSFHVRFHMWATLGVLIAMLV